MPFTQKLIVLSALATLLSACGSSDKNDPAPVNPTPSSSITSSVSSTKSSTSSTLSSTNSTINSSSSKISSTSSVISSSISSAVSSISSVAMSSSKSSISSSSAPAASCDTIAASTGKNLYTSASCLTCHGEINEETGKAPGTTIGPMFNVNNYAKTNSGSLKTYIATQMMEFRKGCAPGNAMCEADAANIATYLKSLSVAKCAIPSVEFEAAINDFIDYQDWELVDYSTGRSNPSGLGDAHAAGNDLFTRKTFKNAAAMKSSAGEYDVGSILIKETFTYTMGEDGLEKTYAPSGGLLAMVKRGGDFNPEHNGWEWFMLKSDLSGVVAQGAEPAGVAGCNLCHSKAESQVGGMDYSFPKPTEFVAEPSIFANYQSWDLIEYDNAPSNLAGGAHIDGASVRRIYQKQVLANPTEAGTLGYPIGTILVKDISKGGSIQEIVAMVKRGGNFDPTNGNWEYFMLDPAAPTTIAKMEGNDVRGAIAMCIGCHQKAKDDAGIDYVFKHSHAPFNTHTTGEYVVNKATLANYTQWMVTDYATGNSNPKLGSAHGATNKEIARQVFENDKALMQTGTNPYPVGSVIVKEVFTTKDGKKDFTGAGVFAMVKRGGTYNPDHAGWEWLIIDGNGNIQERGSNLKNNGCNACHSNGTGAAGVDYTFNKPSEFIATLEDIKEYKSWTLVDQVTGDNLANGGAHSVSGTRKTYKKQASASPYTEAGKYPVGTIIVKEITNTSGAITHLYAMVKRGGSFNSTGGGWEWYTPSTNLSSVGSLGTGSGCSGCHSKAGDKTKSDPSFLGVDYVFYKKDDPVPMPVTQALSM